MALIHKQPVHTQLLKSYYIILSGLVIKFLHPRLQTLFCFFQLLDGIILPCLMCCFFNGKRNICNLIFQHDNLKEGFSQTVYVR